MDLEPLNKAPEYKADTVMTVDGPVDVTPTDPDRPRHEGDGATHVVVSHGLGRFVRGDRVSAKDLGEHADLKRLEGLKAVAPIDSHFGKNYMHMGNPYLVDPAKPVMRELPVETAPSGAPQPPPAPPQDKPAPKLEVPKAQDKGVSLSDKPK